MISVCSSKIPEYAMLYFKCEENISDIVQTILFYTPERALVAGESSDLNSPFKLNPGARVELRTCSQLVYTIEPLREQELLTTSAISLEIWSLNPLASFLTCAMKVRILVRSSSGVNRSCPTGIRTTPSLSL